MNKSLHILIVSSWYKTPEHPTIGSFVEEQARMLMRKGHTVSIVHPSLKGTFFETLKNRKTEVSIENDAGIQTIRVKIAPVFPRLRKLAYKKLCSATVKYIEENYIHLHGKPDLIHSHSAFMGGIVGLHLSKKLNIPIVHTEHTSGLLFSPEQYNKEDKILLKNMFQDCKKVLFVSAFAKNETVKQFKLNGDHYSILHNVVDNTFFENVPNSTPETFSYIAINNLIPRKQVEMLIKAWAILIKEYPKSKLTIAGNGAQKNSLLELREALNLDDSIEFTDGLSRENVKKQIAKHNTLVSSSALETFGLTLAEAIALGKPIVVSDSGGARDIVNTENGIITNQSAESLAKGLISVQHNYGSFDAEKIKSDAFNRFSEETIYKQLIDHYSNFTS